MADPSLCEKCGRCCYTKLIIDGEVVYTPFPCQYLDEDTRRCTAYERRHELNVNCTTIEMGISLGLFPGDCPYVRDLPHYHPPRMTMTPEELEACADTLLETRDVRGPAGEQAAAVPSDGGPRTADPREPAPEPPRTPATGQPTRQTE